MSVVKKKFKEFATINPGQSPKSEFYSEEEGFPFLQGNRTFGILYPKIDTYTKKTTKIAPKGSILMSVRAPIGDLNIAHTDICIGRGIAAINANDGDNTFLYYCLKYNINNLIKQGTGTTYNSVNKDIVNEFELIMPADTDERRLIGKILSYLDKKIELNNKINQKLEAMAKMIYDYWFVQFDFPDANGKPYKSSGGNMVYSEELKREIPDGWDVDSLWNIADYYNGLAMQKYRPTDQNNRLPVIKIKEMNEGFSDKTEWAKSDIPKEAIVENGDVLFSWSATLKVMLWAQGRGALNQHIFKVTSSKYPKTFYYFELKNYLHHFVMMAEKRKTTMGHITQDHLKDSYIVIPPKNLIESIDKKLSPLLNKLIILEEENQKLTQLRDWLLPMLMNGQVKVSEAANMVKEALMAAEPKLEYGKG